MFVKKSFFLMTLFLISISVFVVTLMSNICIFFYFLLDNKVKLQFIFISGLYCEYTEIASKDINTKHKNKDKRINKSREIIKYRIHHGIFNSHFTILSPLLKNKADLK